jgi:hypothetical protein
LKNGSGERRLVMERIILRKMQTKKLNSWIKKMTAAAEYWGKTPELPVLACKECGKEISSKKYDFCYYFRQKNFFICEKCLDSFVKKNEKHGFEVWIGVCEW